jgi:hypothetical protein
MARSRGDHMHRDTGEPRAYAGYTADVARVVIPT